VSLRYFISEIEVFLVKKGPYMLYIAFKTGKKWKNTVED